VALIAIQVVEAQAGLGLRISGAQAQGISNNRDGMGNLVQRGATTRTYPAMPIANSAIAPAPPPHGYVAIKRSRTIVIRPRR
jgi:hypothetical protein